MGVALTPCITPSSGEPSFELGDDEMEIGIGIHGEPGRYREPMAPDAQIVERLATAVVEDLPYESGDQVLAFVNGMGGTPLLELFIVLPGSATASSRAGHHDHAAADRQLHHLAVHVGPVIAVADRRSSRTSSARALRSPRRTCDRGEDASS